MKYLTFAFLILALAAIIAAIWLPPLLWQLLITAAVLLLAAASVEAAQRSKQ